MRSFPQIFDPHVDRQTPGKASIVQNTAGRPSQDAEPYSEKTQDISLPSGHLFGDMNRNGGFSGCTADICHILNRLRSSQNETKRSFIQVLVFFGVQNQDCQSHNSACILLLMPKAQDQV